MTSPRPTRVRLGAGREFDMIRAFLGTEERLPEGVELGSGDDAAVLDGGWVISTDLAVEDVHFRRGWLTDEEIGYRAAAAALSDLAAMAARPVGVLVSMAAARGAMVDVASAQAGVRAAAEALGARIIGGDLSRSPGPLFIDVVVLGRTEHPVSRAGARAGDELWVSGTLGTSGAALHHWADDRVPPEPLRRRFAKPEPRIALGLALGRAGVAAAMLDLSDGLAGDAGHLAAASGVGVVIEESEVPVDLEAVAALGEEAALEAALHAGEDFELLFAARPGAVAAMLEAGTFDVDVPLTRVGRVVEARTSSTGGYDEDGPPLVLLEGPTGDLRPVGWGGFDHWSD
jgi:thiamine-monophosphate kinase